MSQRLVCLVAALAVGAGGTAWAEDLPASTLLLPPKRAVEQSLPNPALAPKTGFNLSAPPLAPAFQPRRTAVATAPQPALQPAPAPAVVRTASAGGDMPLAPAAKPAPARAAAAAPAAAPAPSTAPAAKPAPVPPATAAAPAKPAPAAAPAKPMEIAAAPTTAPAARSEPLTDAEIVEKANAYFNQLGTLVADFTQIGGDGRRLGGTLYLQRPGKVRFEYDKPSTLEVVADGSSVAVRDTKLATQDLYSISQTPLKFLLRERVNLGRDIRITSVANDGDAVRLALEDRSTLGGTSKITLFFDPQVESLTQWRIVDPQGFQTTVMLNKVDRSRRVDQRLFVINYERILGNENSSR
ncbi:MAG TPA: outer-membrane lipoprotein carrier protein LolA [Microvirga sp.]|jgi:outer membrane lipoprotein-sorting protein